MAITISRLSHLSTLPKLHTLHSQAPNTARLSPKPTALLGVAVSIDYSRSAPTLPGINTLHSGTPSALPKSMSKIEMSQADKNTMTLRAEIAEYNKNPPVVNGFKRYRLAPPIPWNVLMVEVSPGHWQSR